MRRLVLDLDDMLFAAGVCSPNEQLAPFREQIASYRAMGFEVVLSSSSGMIGPDGSLRDAVGGVTPEVLELLAQLRGLCDEIVFGKPPTGPSGLVLDDKAVTPEEFLAHDYEQIRKLISGD